MRTAWSDHGPWMVIFDQDENRNQICSSEIDMSDLIRFDPHKVKFEILPFNVDLVTNDSLFISH